MKAIGHEACRRGYCVLFRSTQRLLGELLADSAEHAERMLHQAIGVDLDFAFRRLDRVVSSAIKLISTTGNSYRKEVMGNSTRSSAKTTAKAEK